MTVLSDNTEQNEVTVCHVLRPCVPSVGEDSFEFRGESWQIYVITTGCYYSSAHSPLRSTIQDCSVAGRVS